MERLVEFARRPLSLWWLRVRFAPLLVPPPNDGELPPTPVDGSDDGHSLGSPFTPPEAPDQHSERSLEPDEIMPSE
eukprot:6173771-Pyramimonas_sp.AAC.1